MTEQEHQVQQAPPEAKRRLRPLRTLKALLLGAALCVAVGAACFFAGRLSAPEPPEPALSAVVLESRLSQVRELASVTYVYTNMAQFQSSNEFYGMTLPFTTKRFILTYDGVIKAGVDLSQATVSVTGKAVTVTLPEAQVLSHQIQQDSVEVFDEKTSIFNPFTVEDYSAFQRDQAAEMETKAIARGLLEEAGAQAAAAVTALLAQTLPKDYALTVR